MSLQQLVYNAPLSTYPQTSVNDAVEQTAMGQLKTNFVATAYRSSGTSRARIPATIMPASPSVHDASVSSTGGHRSVNMGSVSGGGGGGGASSGGFDAAVNLELKGAAAGPLSQTSSAVAAAEMDASGSVRACARSKLSMLRVLQICADMAQGLAFLHATPLVQPARASELLDTSVHISVHDAAGAASGAHSDAASPTMAASSDPGFEAVKATRVVHRGG